jgi:hypothetical protein
VKLFCPECGQKLAVPSHDLQRMYRCPRCGVAHVAADLVSKRTTVPIVAVDDAVTLETAMPPQLVEPEASTPEDAIPETQSMPATARMPGAPGHAAAGGRSVTAPMAARPMPNAPPTGGPVGAIGPSPVAGFSAPVPQAPGAYPYQTPPHVVAQPQYAARPPVPWPVPQGMAPPVAVPPGVGWPAGQPWPPQMPNAAPVVAASAFPAVDQAAPRTRTPALVRGIQWFDAKLVGYRAVALGGAAAVADIASPINDTWYLVATIVFAALLVVLGLARALSLVSDGLLGHRIKLTFQSIGERTNELLVATPPERARRLRNAALLLGLIALAVRPIVLGFVRTAYSVEGVRPDVSAASETFLVIGFGMLALAVGAFFWRLRATSSRATTSGLPRTGNSMSMASGIRGLDPVLDLAGGMAVAPRVADPLLGGVLAALACWKPSRRCEYEIDYRDSLLNHLRNRLPEVHLRPEFPIAQNGELRKIDIVVAQSIALELKRALGAAASQRARGQVEDYLDMWKQGPVLLVICETPPGFGDSLVGRKVRALHGAGKAVLAIAAGKRSRW